MAPPPTRKTQKLRIGRVSEPGATYFISACTKNRVAVLTEPNSGKILTTAMHTMYEAGDFSLIAATVMPDHFHILLTLGDRLSVGQVAGKMKALAREQGKAAWQESTEDYAFYIFMNPYRAGMCPLNSSWPWWHCPQPRQFQFLAALDQLKAMPSEWLGLSDNVASKITTGE
jgi:REP element-mobilizing transposase RayT